jgi:putative redox protein
MVEQTFRYLGELRVEAQHGPSQTMLITDAPVDNQGRGESFSPTDLVGTALGTCMLTLMGIVAKRHQLDLSGATARVTKEMSATPPRRIARLAVEIHVPREFSVEEKTRLEKAALTCPVHHSLHPDIDSPVTFRYGG